MNKILIIGCLIFIFIIIVGKGWLDDNRRAPLKDPSQINWVPPKEEQFQLLNQKDDCYFEQSTCTAHLANGDTFEISIGPKPIEPNKNLVISLKAKSQKYVPVAVDLQGLNLNMGFIRPNFKENSTGEFQAIVNLPICDEKKMHWKALLLLQEKENSETKSAIQFYFNSAAP